MRPILAVVVGVIVVYACMHFFVLPEAPDVTRIENITHLESPAYHPAILDLWEIAVENTGVENESAVLRKLEVDLAGDGAIRVIWLIFYGDKDGEQHGYEAYVGPGGTVSAKSQKFNFSVQGVHPLELLREVDAIALEDIPFREQGMTILLSPNAYGDHYNETRGRLYEVSDGAFRPVKEVMFGPDARWYTITITPHRSPGSPPPPEEVLIAFTRQDLAAAESVVYG
ncbi:hypothetical protein HL657_01580 [Methanoculleus sp. YWC-01]|jgi:hypothetical protein|uniref:Uncharacterized protein n=1 Tax=Methanoculleus nereidis TaxID=2735141 RepID=A0ABU3YZ98_9EURY|nr:hypothetical protein [Methanoculleus sp. YWC-01]MDV4341888.1 hypothetical protein [Methanoculleus sp. YWC-01]PKL54909.1 MAG: hypothetical protein CVV35_12830 [Methanomicrobiales archaeon HGW-Methanomicrobiales-6]